METRESLQAAVDRMTQQFGPWSYDIPLPFGVWTKGNLGVAHGRLQRLLQAALDACGGSLNGRRVLDLGCLEGLFALEFAKHGAEVVGIEIRESNLTKANLCKQALGLDRVTFELGDVRQISVEKHGRFDVIICSGILYHLAEQDVFELMATMYEMATQVVIVDTHIALDAQAPAEFRGKQYQGLVYREHAEGSSSERRAKRAWASLDNTTSYWLTRASLVNLMLDCGYTSVYEALMAPPDPADLVASRADDRCTFIGRKTPRAVVQLSPMANQDSRRWPEGSLAYGGTVGAAELVRQLKKNVRSTIQRVVRSR